MIRFQRILLILILATLISGLCFSVSMAEDDYPKLYGKELPRYLNAKLVSTGRQVSSLKDGLRLQLISLDSVRIIASYYEEKMQNLGWTVPKQRFPNDKMYLGNFTKDNLNYQIQIMRLDPNKDETTIDVVYAER